MNSASRRGRFPRGGPGWNGAWLAVILVLAGTASAASAPPDRRAPTKPTIAGQAQPTTLRPVFTFAATDQRTPRGKMRYRCAFDQAALRPCGRLHRPAAALAFGPHTLRVRALDLAGNLSRVTSRAFSIVGRWDAARDFQRAPRQANPGLDSYGNTTWSYLYSSQGRAHNPASYRPLPSFAVLGPNWEVWQLQPDFRSAAAGFSNGQTFMHPGPASPGQNAIVGWRSPLAGDIRIEASVSIERQSTCSAPANGVRWSLDQDAQTLSGGIVSAGGVANVARTATVAVGETLYLVVEDNGDPACDSTVVRFLIEMA